MVTGVQEVPCSGLGIKWLPGSIWETYLELIHIIDTRCKRWDGNLSRLEKKKMKYIFGLKDASKLFSVQTTCHAQSAKCLSILLILSNLWDVVQRQRAIHLGTFYHINNFALSFRKWLILLKLYGRK
jgi:hypothetical protein